MSPFTASATKNICGNLCTSLKTENDNGRIDSRTPYYNNYMLIEL